MTACSFWEFTTFMYLHKRFLYFQALDATLKYNNITDFIPQATVRIYYYMNEKICILLITTTNYIALPSNILVVKKHGF